MAAAHYTWLKDIPALLPIGPDPELHASTEKFIWAILFGTLIALLARWNWKRTLSRPSKDLVIPEGKVSVHSIFELFVDEFTKFHDSVVGAENRKYVSLSATIFIFLFLSNIIGLIPGVAAITTTVWVNVALSVTVFIYFNYLGIKEHGLVGYLKHFCGPVLILAPLILAIEIFSTFLRIITLNLRLFWNITADHIVLDTFTDLLVPPFPVVLYAFGTFVCFMQAFVFTILTMIYILLATHHEEEQPHTALTDT